MSRYPRAIIYKTADPIGRTIVPNRLCGSLIGVAFRIGPRRLLSIVWKSAAPEDPRARALWLKEHRSTGPDKDQYEHRGQR